MAYVYLRDLDKDKQNEGFLGKGINELKEQAEKENKEVIVGEYFEKPYLD